MMSVCLLSSRNTKSLTQDRSFARLSTTETTMFEVKACLFSIGSVEGFTCGNHLYLKFTETKPIEKCRCNKSLEMFGLERSEFFYSVVFGLADVLCLCMGERLTV